MDIQVDQKVIDRFWKKVDIRGIDDCWEWKTGKDSDGYGGFSIGLKSLKAHRVAWTITYGGIPEGLLVCHHCDNPPCCNPNHLFLGTTKDNAIDRMNKGRQPIIRGEDRSYTKLKLDQVKQILIMSKQGKVNCREIARNLNMSDVQIWRIVHRKRWEWVDV